MFRGLTGRSCFNVSSQRYFDITSGAALDVINANLQANSGKVRLVRTPTAGT